MKNFLLTVVITIGCIGSVKAQTSYFVVDEEQHFMVQGHLPGSDIQLCTRRDGGKVLVKSPTTDEKVFKLVTSLDVKPDFILNRTNANVKNIRGNGKVQDLGRPEFILKNVRVQREGVDVKLTWDAMVDPVELVEFEIYRSWDGEDYSRVYAVSGSPVLTSQQYKFEEKHAADVNVYYRISVRSSRGQRYATKSYFLSGSLLNIFPTIVHQKLNLEVSEDYIGKSYRIVGIDGRIYKNSRVEELFSTIDVSELLPGTYFLQGVGSESKSVKFVKQ